MCGQGADVMNSVIRFGEISATLAQFFKSWQNFEGLFRWQNFDPRVFKNVLFLGNSSFL